MIPGLGWYVLSAFAFGWAIVALLCSAIVFLSIAARLSPLLTETRQQIQDLGDLAANTVGRVADTLDVVELRVSQALGEAVVGGKAASQQAMSVGSVVAGIYLVSRFWHMARARIQGPRRKSRRRR